MYLFVFLLHFRTDGDMTVYGKHDHKWLWMCKERYRADHADLFYDTSISSTWSYFLNLYAIEMLSSNKNSMRNQGI